MKPTATVLSLLLGAAMMGAASAAETPLGDKTLVVWAAPATLTQRGGSALAVDDLKTHFDGIVFGELSPRRWMAGSDFYRRTQRDQEAWPAETADAKTTVQVAIVYRGKQVTIYRDGKQYAAYTMGVAPLPFGPQSIAMMGRRHLESAENVCFGGAIEDARIYDAALTAEQIAALKPNVASEPKPWAWWSFEGDKAVCRVGRFTEVDLVGGARVEGGRLILDGKTGTMYAARSRPQLDQAVGRTKAAIAASGIEAARELRLQLLADPHRPAYHFVIPEDFGYPFDPNGAVFWNGRYHLCYIYQDKRVHYWGHASSLDLLHWRHHPPALFPTPDSPDRGIFSGNCFINKKGEATLLYHGVGAGNCISTSADEQLDTWTKLPSNPIIPNPPKGAAYRSWDPHGWLEGDTYYAIFGGQQPAIFKAKTLDKWEYVGDLLANTVPGVSIREDVSCPDLFKLGDKHMLLCISHRLGCRYFLGEWKGEQFHPSFHERMSWVDNAFFAPESLLDGKGRRIMWAWIFDGRSPRTRGASGWSGTMSLPRVLSLGDDGRLRIRPIEELERLRYNARTHKGLTVEADGELLLDDVKGDCIELRLEMVPDGAKQFGVKVCCSPEGEEQTLVYYDAADQKLKIDTRKSSLGEGPKKLEAGPLALKAGALLTLHIFIDKSVVEVFGDDRQGVMRRVYPSRRDSLGVRLFSLGGPTAFRRVEAWDMMPSNPF